jgi:hypothetical protein
MPALVLALLALALVPGPGEARMYRWVDDDGVVHYTDQLPPTQVEKGHTKLNEQGLKTETVAPAQSLEEVQRDRELERLRSQQQRLVEQQNAADRVLLRTYRSVDDLNMARDGKIAAIDVLIGVARGNIRRQQDWLRNLRTEAANQERAGKSVPPHLTESMEKTERYIRESYAAIVEREQEKERIRADFDRDLKRFRQLNDLPEDASAQPVAAARPMLNNLVSCRGAEQCDRYWSRALTYVRAHATTQVQAAGSNILIMAPPEEKDDLSLILSRVQEKGGDAASLFLDLQCRNQGSEDSTCRDERSKQVLEGFRAAVSDPEPTGPLPEPTAPLAEPTAPLPEPTASPVPRAVATPRPGG